VVSRFLELLNARDLTGAYALTSQAYQERIPVEGFTIAFGDQRFNFPRIAGNPYRNRGDRRVHEYRVSLYVETEARRIPALESLSRLPVTEARAYAERLETLVEQLTSLGVEPAFLRQLRKERLERADAARYIQLVCGLSDAQLATLYPETVPVTLDLTLFFEVIRLPDDTWRIAEVQDATERLVAF